MPRKILVGYATKYGSTREVADAMAAQLRTHGFEVDLLPLKSIRKLEGYDAAVIGAPLYMFHWMKDATAFLSKFQSRLTRLPVAVFALGPFNDKESEWAEVRRELDGELAKFPWLKPVSIKVVGGKFDPAALTFPYNLIPAMKSLPPSDILNWEEIRAWADEVAENFKAQHSQIV